MSVCEAPILKGPNKGQPAWSTGAGYRRHQKVGEPACERCLEGAAARVLEYANADREKVRATNREASRRYRLANMDACRERVHRWWVAHPGKNMEYMRLWRAANYERDRENARRWQRANPEKNAEWSRRYHAQKLKVFTLPFSVEDLAARMGYWGNRCWMCRGPFEAVDHVKPLSKGGAHILSNLRPACVSCNSSKKDKWPLENA